MDGPFLMMKYSGILLTILVLGCENETTDLDDILTNPLDENQVIYDVPENFLIRNGPSIGFESVY